MPSRGGIAYLRERCAVKGSDARSETAGVGVGWAMGAGHGEQLAALVTDDGRFSGSIQTFPS